MTAGTAMPPIPSRLPRSPARPPRAPRVEDFALVAQRLSGEHRAIYEALVAGKASLAADLVATHIQGFYPDLYAKHPAAQAN